MTIPKDIPAPDRDPCNFCGGQAVLHEDSTDIYGTNYGPVWQCPDCKARVGCHPGTTKPLGRLADKELRGMKMMVHSVFDPLWEAKKKREGISKAKARGTAYSWLADQLNIPRDKCHIGYFDKALCEKAVEICGPYARKLNKGERNADQ